MIRIEPEAWAVMLEHARACFPRECCGIMIGGPVEGGNEVTMAVACHNAYDGDRNDRFVIDPKDYAAAERAADQRGRKVIGFFHSHPNEDSYFSATDLKYSWPWFSNVVLSIRDGKFQRARSFVVDIDQTAAEEEPLHHPES
jgi:proteasome lid subunit RPN8/RPN11